MDEIICPYCKAPVEEFIEVNRPWGSSGIDVIDGQAQYDGSTEYFHGRDEIVRFEYRCCEREVIDPELIELLRTAF